MMKHSHVFIIAVAANLFTLALQHYFYRPGR